MSIRLIVNADDYGRDDEVSLGIRKAHLQGIVTSTTAMMNMAASEANLRLALRETPHLGLGVHLVLTSGKPLLPGDEVSTLIDEKGDFLRPKIFAARLEKVDPAQVMAEWRAQVEKFIRVTGRKPTHLDSHHHSSYYASHVFRSMLTLAAELGCAIRRPAPLVLRNSKTGTEEGQAGGFIEQLMHEFKPRAPHRFIDAFYDEQATKATLEQIINHLRKGDTELMCHPGLVGKALLATSIYNHQRERELEILSDPQVRQWLSAKKVDLITFEAL